jgi:3-demethoxyubiquinol 3-hydroxylase
MDAFIKQFDFALRTCFVRPSERRPMPPAEPSAALTNEERSHASALMRVNHAGEVAAQGLYQGQIAQARNPALKAQLIEAAEEEIDHLAWTADRVKALDSHTSFLNPLWYAGAFALGTLAGKISDKTNLAFLRATEEQVSRHLAKHLTILPLSDTASRAVVTTMLAEETAHALQATVAGGYALTKPIQIVMKLYAKCMTFAAYRI